MKNTKTAEVTRKDIHDATKDNVTSYSQLVNPMNSLLESRQIPVPGDQFGRTVVRNAKKVEEGEMHTSTAFLNETPYLAANAVGHFAKGAAYAVAAIGTCPNTEIEGHTYDPQRYEKAVSLTKKAAEHVTLGAISTGGVVGTVLAASALGGVDHSKEKIGQGYMQRSMQSWGRSAIVQQEKTNQTEQQENTTLVTPTFGKQ